MSLWIFAKVLGDVLLLHTVLGAFVCLFSFPVSGYITALLCAIGAGIACVLSENQKRHLRFNGLIFPSAIYFLLSEPVQLIPLIPMLVYTWIIIIRGNFNLDYYSYRQAFIRTLIVLGVYLLLTSVIDYLYYSIGAGETPIIDLSVFGRYGLVYAVCGVYLQRSLRFGIQSSKADRRLNNLQLAGVIIGAVALVTLAVSIQELVMRAIWLAMSALSTATGGAAFPVIHTITNLLEVNFEKTEEEINDFNAIVNGNNQAGLIYSEVVEALPETLQRWSGFFAVAAVLLICILLLVLFYFFLKTGKEPEIQRAIAKTPIPKTSDNRTPRDNRWKVRRHYRDFLKFEREHGFLIRTTHTSADILEKITDETNPEAAAQLRQVYLKARYDEKSEITPADVRAAKTAMSMIKSKNT